MNMRTTSRVVRGAAPRFEAVGISKQHACGAPGISKSRTVLSSTGTHNLCLY